MYRQIDITERYVVEVDSTLGLIAPFSSYFLHYSRCRVNNTCCSTAGAGITRRRKAANFA